MIEVIEQPYIRLRLVSDSVHMDGLAHCELGHRIKQGQQPGKQGVFAEWTWDGKQLAVRNDRYGYYPLFYALQKDSICVSSSLLKLLELGVPNALNATGMSVFLRIGWFIGDHTPFEAIRAFPPGGTLVWEHGTSKLASERLPRPSPTQIGYDEAIDQYTNLFRAAIHTHAPPSKKFVVPLSGGKDSRLILLALLEAGYTPEACVTQRRFPVGTYSADQDVEPAIQLCQELALRHDIVDQTPSRFSAEVRKNQMTEFCALEHAWGLPFTDYINQHWEYAYDGVGGDVISGSPLLSETTQKFIETEDYEGLANRLLQDSEGYYQHFVHPKRQSDFYRELAVQALVEEIAKHTDAASPIDSFFFENRTRRLIGYGTFKTWARKTKVVMPYLDEELFDFAASMPAQILTDRRFRENVIAKAYPKYSHIPYDDKHHHRLQNLRYHRRFASESAAYILRHPKGPLLRRSRSIPRLLRCLVDSKYCDEIIGFGPLAVYLCQLEKYV